MYIVTGAACHLYFDLEFLREHNSDCNGVAMTQTFVKVSTVEALQGWEFSGLSLRGRGCLKLPPGVRVSRAATREMGVSRAATRGICVSRAVTRRIGSPGSHQEDEGLQGCHQRDGVTRVDTRGILGIQSS